MTSDHHSILRLSRIAPNLIDGRRALKPPRGLVSRSSMPQRPPARFDATYPSALHLVPVTSVPLLALGPRSAVIVR